MSKKESTKKDNIKYYEAEITCVTCSNVFTSGSTKGSEVRVDTCSNCHPFYTGKQQFGQATGRVERLRKQQEKQQEILKHIDSKKQEVKKVSGQAEKKVIKSNEDVLKQLEQTFKK